MMIDLFNLIILFLQTIANTLQMQSFTPRSSFNPIIVSSSESAHQDLLEKECKRIISSKEKVEIRQIEPHFVSYPYILRLILSLYYTLSEINYYGSESAYFKSPITSHIKYSVLKLLANIIEKRLFVCTDSPRLYDEMSFSLVFKQCLFSLIISVLSENTNFVFVQKLITFYKNLSSEQHLIFLPIHIYHLYGGGIFTIQARAFSTKLTTMIQALGKVLATSDTIISRNIEQFKGNRQRRTLLEESVKVVMMAKDRTVLTQVVNYLCGKLFGGKQQLQKQQFLQLLHNRTIEPVLMIFLMLIRSQILLFEDKAFRTNIQLRSQIAKTNFYACQLAKLFSKCPYNGDERCVCKKCQCVRRNRESAKVSQDRKRNALEQVESFKRRIDELEQRETVQEEQIERLEVSVKRQVERMVELQEQNLMLRSLLAQMKANPTIKHLMMQTIEPVSKVLNNQFD